MKKLLIATHNPAKFAQIKYYIQPQLPEYTLISLADCKIFEDVEETGKTLEQNALLKACFYAKHSGFLTIADDSGLFVNALDGQPGVYSRRYAGEHATDEEKIDFLLKKLENIPLNQRQAAFKAAVAVCIPESLSCTVFHGSSHGTITTHARGTLKSGFAYYSIYELAGYGKTLAELEEAGAMPHAAHHRLQALDQAIEILKSIS